MFKKQKTKLDFGDLRETELTWESSRIDLIQKSERKAWNVCKLLSLVIVCLILSLVFLMPLKTVEPFVIQTDKTTGMSEILHIANTRDIPVSEVMNKYWISQYVLARETYDYQTINNDYLKVRELSLAKVFEPYATQFDPHNPEALDTVLKDDYRILTKLISVVINDKNVATVRFNKQTINNNSNAIEETKTWTATLGFNYYPKFDVPEEKRLINPFGFKITSYRVDEELKHE